MERGSLVLIGVGGTGRSTMCKLAAFLVSLGVYEIEITKSYKENNWKDDMRKLLK